jgi:hypothetical protein
MFRSRNQLRADEYAEIEYAALPVECRIFTIIVCSNGFRDPAKMLTIHRADVLRSQTVGLARTPSVPARRR